MDFTDTIMTVAKMMASAAITAPKTRGINKLEVKIFSEPEKDEIAELMEKIGKREKLHFFERDSKNVKASPIVVFIGSRIAPRGVPYCGFCGFKDCNTCESHGAYCSYAACDLGIAIGSAVSIASLHHIDNRVMFSFGKAAIEGGFVSRDIKIGFGIPLSVTGKNIYFDRKY